MRELINLHIGQAGINTGGACWELFCLEHGISPDGQLQDPSPDDVPGAIFAEAADGRRVPRCVFADTEPEAVDGVLRGEHRDLFGQEQFVAGKEGTASNYSSGYYSIGKPLVDPLLDRIRVLAEGCDAFDGFLLHHSCEGGTGSGFASLLLERLGVDYGEGHKGPHKVAFSIWPSPRLTSTVVAPYNAALSFPAFLQHATARVLFDNEAMLDICARQLCVEHPTFANVNRLFAQMVSSVTAPMRFNNGSTETLVDALSLLVPYPAMQCLLPSYAPLIPPGVAEQPSVAEMTVSAFQTSSMLIKCDPRGCKEFACRAMFRGDVQRGDVIAPVAVMSKHLHIVDWAPRGLQTVISPRAPFAVPGGDLARVSKACCALSNSTAVVQVFAHVGRRFDVLHAKKAFQWHFHGQGMESGEFEEARESLRMAERDYVEGAVETAEAEEEEEEA